VALASSPVKAQTGGAEVALIKFYYIGLRMHAVIVRPTGQPEEQEIKGNNVEEAQFCQKIIAKLCQEGYVLKTSLALGTASSSTVILTKEK
jgi:hypothetical protein